MSVTGSPSCPNRYTSPPVSCAILHTRMNKHVKSYHKSDRICNNAVTSAANVLQATRAVSSRATLSVSAAATSPKNILMLGEQLIYARHTILSLRLAIVIVLLKRYPHSERIRAEDNRHGMTEAYFCRWHTIHWSLFGPPAD